MAAVMLQQPTPPRPYKSSRPFLSFLKPVKPLRADGPLFPPPREPLPARPERPDTSCSILADPEVRDSPPKQYPSVSFASPVMRRHSRNASTPMPERTPPSVRARSGTLQISTNTFGTSSPPRVIARDFGASPAGRYLALATGTQPEDVPASTAPHARKKPTALRLQTSNLAPPLPIVSPGTPTPTPPRAAPPMQLDTGHSDRDHPVSATIARKYHRRERRRSRSTGDLTAMTTTSSTPSPPNHRVPRSESAMQLDDHPPPKLGRREVYTPASTLSGLSVQTPGSEDTISPEKSSSGTGGRFENVSLPWSTHLLSCLEFSLPSTYLSSALTRLLATTPVILTPDTFASLSSEETRLQLELDRLKVKHTRLSQHRDRLLARSFARVQTVGTRDRGAALLQAVQEAISRVDRVSRQIFICNDQIRQMEVMKRDHEVGVLLWAAQRGSGTASGSASPGSSGSDKSSSPIEIGHTESETMPDHRGKVDNSLSISVPDIQLTRATIADYPRAESEEECEYLNSPVVNIDTTAEDDADSKPQPQPESRPLSTVSTISLSLSPINLGFPLPPSRPSFLPSPGGGAGDDSSLTVTYDTSPLLTPTSGNQIVIYPPSSTESPIPMPDMPHTPLRSEMDHSHSHSSTHAPGGQGERPLPPLPPLRERRSKPDLSVYVPSRSTLNTTTTVRQVPVQSHPAPRVGDLEMGMGMGVGTSPLRVHHKAKYQSLALRTESSQKEFKRARESGLQDTESILLSLATAELWTKEALATY